MTYENAIESLEKSLVFGIKPGMQRIKKLLELLDNPEKAYKVIHVTGTNGKGSVVAMITKILELSGIKTGRFTSPHLIEYTERFYLCGAYISKEKFAEMYEKVQKAVQIMKEEGYEQPTEFEMLTAMAFLYFKEENVEYAVVEVGMGGLLDSTNVVEPEISVITNVAMDHMKILGKDIKSIAEQKAGIIKEKKPVVTSATNEALSIISKEAEKKHSKIYVYNKDFAVDSVEVKNKGQIIKLKADIKEISEKEQTIEIPLNGKYQSINAAVAWTTVKLLENKEKRITNESILKGFLSVIWHGRFEIFEIDGNTIILDGAHNFAGAKTLNETLNQKYKNKKRLVIFSSLKDKETQKILKLIVRENDTVFFVEAPTKRTRTFDELKKMTDSKHFEMPNVKTALDKALKISGKDNVIIVCGSLYILGDALKFINGESDK
ncbi:MAG: folylpolyglutamate synthase/dihydrofolate synthase family protein [Dialister micraerophilus]|nr:folylpolyglutamate synthase/dihydrofolate synthase family protein [Dialister micraerophilus]